jgi:outer membrane cobalamin receptor
LNSSASADRARSIEEWSGITGRAHALLETIGKSFKTKMDDFDTSNAEMVARVNDSVSASIKSIENTESAYKEQMKLQASVEYWNVKAAAHRKAAQSSRFILVLFTVVGSFFYWVLSIGFPRGRLK